MEYRLILINLLVKLGVAAAIAAGLVRWVEFKSLLFREERSLKDRFYLVLWLAISAWVGIRLALGVWIRFGAESLFIGDLSFETTILLGAIAGRFAGATGGALLALPEVLSGGSWLLLPLNVLIGLVSGQLREFAPHREEIWKFSPFNYLSIYRWIRRADPRPSFGDWQMVFLLTILGMRFLQLQAISRWMPGLAYGPHPRWVDVLIYATSVMVIVIELKIWNGVRLQIKLEEQERLLLRARMTALQNQINPHFLFNTLNSVASLIRLDPDQARQVVYKLSKILRRLLRQQDNFATLRDELGFIEDYLAIEMVRFGDKLRFVKEVDPDTLDLLVPSMLLQPLVENCIRHGLASKVDGGTIRVRSRRIGSQLQVVVEDDGVGIPESRLARMFEQGGIGVTNVNERLKVLYGDSYRMWIDSRPGEGTSTGIEIPEQVSGTVVGVESLVGSG
jgi:two-component system LytT family sensor kinase